MTEAQERFARRAVRRKKLFLGLSVAGLVLAPALAVFYLIRRTTDPAFPIVPRMVIVLLILLNARQNLRQYKYAGLLESLLPSDPAAR